MAYLKAILKDLHFLFYALNLNSYRNSLLDHLTEKKKIFNCYKTISSSINQKNAVYARQG